jgi:hypothetical protein
MTLIPLSGYTWGAIGGAVVGHQIQVEREDDMGASEAMTMFFQLMGGLGLFFTRVGVLWFVTVYKEKRE